MPHKKKILVIGSGYDALWAAASARLANEHASIIVVAEHSLMLLAKEKERLLLSTTECQENVDDEYQRRFHLQVWRPACAYDLDVDAQTVMVKKHDVRERLAYDALIFASQGSIEPAPHHHIKMLGFHTAEDMLLIKQAIHQKAQRILMVGLSPQAIHAAHIFHQLGLNVSIIDDHMRLMQQFSWTMTRDMVLCLKDLSIKVMVNQSIANFTHQDDGVIKVLCKDGDTHDFDLVIDGAIKKEASLLADAGALFDHNGFIVVDDRGCTTLAKVYAAGVSVTVEKSISRQKVWMPYENIREKVAEQVGKNAALNDSSHQEVSRSFAGSCKVIIGTTAFIRTGLSPQEARTVFSDDGIFSIFVSNDAGGLGITLKKQSNVIVGAELYGDNSIDRIADLLALSLQQGLSIFDVAALDVVDNAQHQLIKDASWCAYGATHEDHAILPFDVFALWLARKTDIFMLDIDDEPSLAGYLNQKTTHIPFHGLPQYLATTSINPMPVVLYSRSGKTRYLAHKMLSSSGLTQVFQLDGFMPNWS